MIDRKPSWKHASASRSDFAAFWTVDLSFGESLVHQSWLLWRSRIERPVGLWTSQEIESMTQSQVTVTESHMCALTKNIKFGYLVVCLVTCSLPIAYRIMGFLP